MSIFYTINKDEFYVKYNKIPKNYSNHIIQKVNIRKFFKLVKKPNL